MILRARWLLPIDRPRIDGGWVEIAEGRIVRVAQGSPPSGATDLGDVVVLPGLVNAHTHLELSWMAGLVPPAASMPDWIRSMIGVRRTGPSGGPEGVTQAAVAAAAAVRATGTVLVGDVANTLETPGIMRAAGLAGVVFHELLGFSAEDPVGLVTRAWDGVARSETALAAAGSAGEERGGEIGFSVVAHAPYSVSPALFREIVRCAGASPLAVHLAESPDEIEFLRTGRGPMRQILESLGVWTDSWPVPACDPVSYIEAFGYLRPGTLIVHGVCLTEDGLERIRMAGAVLVTCPRSNIWVGVGPPRLARAYASGVPIAIGTDSLASTASLSLFDELAEARRLAPEVSAAALLDSATRVGANALGFGRRYGTLAPGKRAALVAVDVPSTVTDVEEYLVGGLPPSSIHCVNG